MLTRRGGSPARPCFDLRTARKCVAYFTWSNSVIEKPVALSLDKLFQNKKKGRPKTSGNCCTFGVRLFFIACTSIADFVQLLSCVLTALPKVVSSH